MQRGGNDSKSLPIQSGMSLSYILSFWFSAVQATFYLINDNQIISHHKDNLIWLIQTTPILAVI